MPGSPAAGALTVRALDLSTWPSFARLVEANGGVFGGCWCMGMHPDEPGGPPAEVSRIKNRAASEKGAPTPPDWRIGCFFVGKGHRRRGVAG